MLQMAEAAHRRAPAEDEQGVIALIGYGLEQGVFSKALELEELFFGARHHDT